MGIRYETSVKRGYIIDAEPDANKSKTLINIAKNWIDKADKLMNGNIYDLVPDALYMCVYNIASASMAKDGYFSSKKDCTLSYFEEKYLTKKMVSHLFIEILSNFASL